MLLTSDDNNGHEVVIIAHTTCVSGQQIKLVLHAIYSTTDLTPKQYMC